MSQSSLFLLLTLTLLPLHYYQDKLVVRSHQYLVLGGLQPDELELVVGVQVADGVLGLADQLRDEPRECVA